MQRSQLNLKDFRYLKTFLWLSKRRSKNCFLFSDSKSQTVELLLHPSCQHLDIFSILRSDAKTKTGKKIDGITFLTFAVSH